jgi:hypothetical protein
MMSADEREMTAYMGDDIFLERKHNYRVNGKTDSF